MSTSGMLILPSTEEEWQRLVNDVLDRRSNSYVQAALQLAVRFIRDEKERKQLFEQLTIVQMRCSELLEDRRTLVRLIEKLASVSSDERDAAISELLTVARAMQ